MATETSDLEKKIIRQIEYYFGDHNLPRDRFLQEQIKEDDGWVQFETMIKFNKLKQISDDIKVIAEAVKKSTNGLIEVSEDGSKLRRHPDNPIPENTEARRLEINNRSVYAKEFPKDAKLEDLQEYFESFGPCDNIQMRKDVHKKFKGSVFVVFHGDEAVKKFLTAEEVKYKDTVLEKRMLKVDYWKEKTEAKKQLQEQKEKKKSDASERQHKDEERNFKNELTKGAILHMKGFDDKTTREDIKNLLGDYGPIAWVDFNKGDPEAWVRYDQENKATDVLEKVTAAMDGKVELNGKTLENRVLEGEEEAARWKKMFQDIRNRMSGNQRRNQKGKSRFGKRPSKRVRDDKRGKNTGGDGGGEKANGEPAAKQAKVGDS
ncbi:lupus La protein homolog [Mya arenaria]|uniref:lupus La protein homolog n=1 Tax=Mya arenaria TaxID=6604 RepID=UPI0022E2CC42|nr:lupus La protein homolog [Mya arenaria]